MTNHEGHIKLWDELARTGGDEKDEAFDTVFNDEIPVPFCFCFACEASLDIATHDRNCDLCPISWRGRGGPRYSDSTPCTRLGSPFDAWCSAGTKKERKRLAAIIRDLPWKEKA